MRAACLDEPLEGEQLVADEVRGHALVIVPHLASARAGEEVKDNGCRTHRHGCRGGGFGEESTGGWERQAMTDGRESSARGESTVRAVEGSLRADMGQAAMHEGGKRGGRRRRRRRWWWGGCSGHT